jgi:hypothetical protein
MSANLTLSAKNHARQALLETDVSNKLDLMAKAIEALAGAVENIEKHRRQNCPSAHGRGCQDKIGARAPDG